MNELEIVKAVRRTRRHIMGWLGVFLLVILAESIVMFSWSPWALLLVPILAAVQLAWWPSLAVALMEPEDRAIMKMIEEAKKGNE